MRARAETDMTYARLQYCRNLRKEITNLELQISREYQKRIRNYNKEHLIKKTLEEARAKQQVVEAEVREWLSSVPLSADMKTTVLNYYVDASGIARENFIRNILYCFGET